jgi:hypothetical protein
MSPFDTSEKCYPALTQARPLVRFGCWPLVDKGARRNESAGFCESFSARSAGNCLFFRLVHCGKVWPAVAVPCSPLRDTQVQPSPALIFIRGAFLCRQNPAHAKLH